MKQEVWNIFNEMTTRGVRDGIRMDSYGIILELCAREGRCDAAYAIMEQLHSKGMMTPDAISYLYVTTVTSGR